MKEPKYVEVGHTHTPIVMGVRRIMITYECKTCGSVVVDRASHTKWHEEQCPEREAQRIREVALYGG